MTYQVNQVVRVEVGDEIPGSPKGERRWVLGSVTAISLRTGVHGNLLTVDIHPLREAGSSLVKRYAQASRVMAGDADDAAALVQLRQEASLTTQPAEQDARDSVLSKASRVQSVNLRANAKGDGLHSKLDEVKLAAIFLHPQVHARVSEVHSSNVRNLTDRINKLEQALDLSNKNLKSCDTERHHLLVRNNELKSEAGNTEVFRKQCDALQMEVNALRASLTNLSEDVVLAHAGKARGFVLWNPKSKIPPTVKYDTLTEARNVQGIMANRCPNEVFHIMPIGPGLKMTVIPATRKAETC